MAKVYVIQERPERNVLSASQYGELTLVLPFNRQIVLSAAPTIQKMRKVLKDFNDEDYLLLMGDPAAIGIACSIVSDLNRGKYKLLKWDKNEMMYYPVQVDLYQKGEFDDGEDIYRPISSTS
jgi:hypothetical protein